MGNSQTSTESKEIEYNDKTTGEQGLGLATDLSNKVAIITGCNSGIGKDTVRVLSNHNCTIIMACRDKTKAQTAKDDIINTLKDTKNAKTLNTRIIIMHLDLADLSSIKQFVINFNQKKLTLNYLVNNAGVFGYKNYLCSKDGYELQFAINHLGHFYLTMLLLPNILSMDNKTEPSRVIHIASATHKDSVNPFTNWIDKHIKLESGPLKNEYSRSGAYSNSKACTVLFARELERRYKNKLVSVAVHPGFVASGIAQNIANGVGDFVLKNIMKPFIKNCDQGSATTLRCIGMNVNELKGGYYYIDCKPANNIVADHLQPKEYDNIEESQEYKCWVWSKLLIKKAGFELALNIKDNDVNEEEKTDE